MLCVAHNDWWQWLQCLRLWRQSTETLRLGGLPRRWFNWDRLNNHSPRLNRVPATKRMPDQLELVGGAYSSSCSQFEMTNVKINSLNMGGIYPCFICGCFELNGIPIKSFSESQTVLFYFLLVRFIFYWQFLFFGMLELIICLNNFGHLCSRKCSLNWFVSKSKLINVKEEKLLTFCNITNYFVVIK